MKKALINYIKNGPNDELYTPDDAVYYLLNSKAFLYYVNGFYSKYGREPIFYECTDYGKSNISKVLEENHFTVLKSHLKDGINFLENPLTENYDCIITNPPYSLKNEFIKQCIDLKKDFFLLLPLTALEGKKRMKLYQNIKLGIAIPDKRFNFMINKKVIGLIQAGFIHIIIC